MHKRVVFDAIAEKVIDLLGFVTPLGEQLYDDNGRFSCDAHLHFVIHSRIGEALSTLDEPDPFRAWFDAIVAIRATREELDFVESARPYGSDEVRASQRLGKDALAELQRLAYDSMFALVLRKLPKPPVTTA